MIAGVVDEDLPVLPVFLSFDPVADAGVPLIGGSQRLRIRQDRFQHFERNHFDTLAVRTGFSDRRPMFFRTLKTLM